jgi:hypothetical protein
MATDRMMAAAVVALVLGSVVCFGGAVWWFRPALAVVVMLLVSCKLVQLLLEGRFPVMKSPLCLLGLLVLALGFFQLVSLPPFLARTVSPTAQEIYAYGTWPALVRSDLPSVRFNEPATVRSPASLDRAATLRWLVGAAACLGVFWSVTHFADRLGRLYLVWGSVVAAFVLNAAFGLVQVTGQADGLYGFLRPGRAPFWAPSADDALETPSTAVLRNLDAASSTGATASAFAGVTLVPEVPYLFGTMMGGTGSFLALGSVALPLALAIVLHITAPRGSRESLSNRLKHTGQGGLAVLLTVMLVASTFLVGLMAGPWFCLPFFAGLVVVGFPRAASSRWLSAGLTLLLLASMSTGATLAELWPAILGGTPPVASTSWGQTRLVWTETLPLVRDFPLLGTGLGSLTAIYPYMKAHAATSTTAMSSLLQFAVESGAIGLFILALAVLWCLVRLPGSVTKVGPADRSLAYGLIGAAVGFSLWSVVHWTVELPAIAISASALGGTWNRWLTGGTDLFVERG